MAQLSVISATMAGVQLNGQFSPADALGDSFLNDGTQNVIVRNSGGVARTVTVKADSHPCNMGLTSAAHDHQVTVPANDTVLVGPFDTARFNDAASLVQLRYDAVTNLQVMAIHYA